jgi:hypothetical protein
MDIAAGGMRSMYAPKSALSVIRSQCLIKKAIAPQPTKLSSPQFRVAILVGFWGKGEGEKGKKKPLTFTL